MPHGCLARQICEDRPLLSFPYVCPEPVLANVWLYYRWRKTRRFLRLGYLFRRSVVEPEVIIRRIVSSDRVLRKQSQRDLDLAVPAPINEQITYVSRQ